MANTTYDGAYESSMSYDANGNLLRMKANGKSGNLVMDQLAYKYDWFDPANPSLGKRSNRLYHVNDVTSTYNTDVDDQGAFTSNPVNGSNLTLINTANNFGYDELGNLKRDNQEQISQIDWTAYGKIKGIQRSAGSTKPVIDFTYDASGNRLSKATTDANGIIKTYYIRDAQGNVLATYESNCTWCLTAKEYSLYGSSRLGVQTAYNYAGEPNSIYARIRKNKNYELTNHLGNVLATISDKKVPIDIGSNGTIDYYSAYVTSTSDYYSFGAPMPGRGYTPTNGYRYGFNGKEKDDEVVGNGNEYDFGARIYNPRLGRWLSMDQKHKETPYYTPYSAFNNCPILIIDPDGKSGVAYLDEKSGTITIKSTMVFYGCAASPELAKETASKIQNMWNAAAGCITIDGKQYDVKFEVTSVVKTEEEATKMAASNGNDAENNFIRLDDGYNFDTSNGEIKSSFYETPGNGGYFLDYEAKNNSTSSHEWGHGADWFEAGELEDGRHDGTIENGIPGIMTPRGVKVDDKYGYGSQPAGSKTVDPNKRTPLASDVNKLKIDFKELKANGKTNVGTTRNQIYDETGKVKTNK